LAKQLPTWHPLTRTNSLPHCLMIDQRHPNPKSEDLNSAER